MATKPFMLQCSYASTAMPKHGEFFSIPYMALEHFYSLCIYINTMPLLSCNMIKWKLYSVLIEQITFHCGADLYVHTHSVVSL